MGGQNEGFTSVAGWRGASWFGVMEVRQTSQFGWKGPTLLLFLGLALQSLPQPSFRRQAVVLESGKKKRLQWKISMFAKSKFLHKTGGGCSPLRSLNALWKESVSPSPA